MEVVVTTGAVSRAKLQSNHQHQQTNAQFFTGRMPFLSPTQQCQSTEGNCSLCNVMECHRRLRCWGGSRGIFLDGHKKTTGVILVVRETLLHVRVLSTSIDQFVNSTLVVDPTIQLPGFDLHRRQWSAESF